MWFGLSKYYLELRRHNWIAGCCHPNSVVGLLQVSMPKRWREDGSLLESALCRMDFRQLLSRLESDIMVKTWKWLTLRGFPPNWTVPEPGCMLRDCWPQWFGSTEVGLSVLKHCKSLAANRRISRFAMCTAWGISQKTTNPKSFCWCWRTGHWSTGAGGSMITFSRPNNHGPWV